MRPVQFNIIRIYLTSIILLAGQSSGLEKSGAIPGTPFIQNFFPKTYNAFPQNWAIVQDHRGIMYFGNRPGVLEYDGENWKMIPVDNQLVVRSLAIDSSGVIYVGGNGEIGALKIDSLGRLSYVSYVPLLKDKEIIFTDVWKTHATRHGIYYVTYNALFHLQHGQMNIIPVEMMGMYSNVVNGTLYIAHKEHGLYAVEGDSLIHLPQSEQLVQQAERLVILPCSDDRLMIVSRGRGFWTYNLNTNNPDESRIHKFETEVEAYILHNLLYNSIPLSRNRYAFGTIYGGIVIMSADGKLLRIINKNRQLQDNVILNLFEDREGHLWAALDKGISRIELGSPLTHFSEKEGLSGIAINTITHNGMRYAITTEGIYYLPPYELTNDDDKHHFFPVENGQGDAFSMLKVNDYLFVSKSDQIAQIIKTEAVDLARLPFFIYAMAQSSRFPNHLFLGMAKGVSVLKIEKQANGSLRLGSRYDFPEIQNQIRKLVSDAEGDLWLATNEDGTIRIHFTDDRVESGEIIRYDTSSGLPGMAGISPVFIENKIIIAGAYGFWRYQENAGSEICFVPENSYDHPFLSNAIDIKKIHSGYAVNTPQGYGYLSRRQGKNISFIEKPFRTVSSIIYAFHQDENGLHWIVGNDGIHQYDPDLPKDYSQPFSSLIRSVHINGDSLLFGGTNYIIKERRRLPAISQPQSLCPVLKPDNHSILFEYSASIFEQPEHLRFSYQLSGYDEDWSYWSRETRKEYTNLPDGKYRFIVKAKTLYGNESQEASFSFMVLPPWYKTPLAYAGFILLFVFILWLGIHINTNRLRAANIRLEKTIRQRTAEINKKKEIIEEKNQELQGKNTHILSSIQYAKTIQQAILPLNERFKAESLNHFILFKPKDIVSGDFYWAHCERGQWVIAVVDCTGHGVPGAFMSMIGHTLLNEIVKVRKCLNPAEILNILHKEVRAALKQETGRTQNQDGMDIAIISLNAARNRLVFAGAKRPLYIIRKTDEEPELIEIKGGRKSIGGKQRESSRVFTSHEIALQKEDAIYLTTDGLADQCNAQGEKISTKRFKNWLVAFNGTAFTEQREILCLKLEAFQADEQQRDDITVMGIRI